MKAARTVVFDVAQVLLGWDPQQMLRRLLPHRAPDAAAAAALEVLLFEHWVGDWVAFDRGLCSRDDLVATIATRTALPAAEVGQVVDRIPLELQPLPGTLALVGALQAVGHRLSFLSNMPAPYVRHLLKEHAFFGRFETGIWSCDVGTSKPADEIFVLAEERFGARGAELVFLDDSAANIAAAQARGWDTVHFTSPVAARAALVAAGLLST